MEHYKKAEERHYDNKAEKAGKSFSYNDWVLRDSIHAYYSLIRTELTEKNASRILDYGCGSGEKHFGFADQGRSITGIDISAKSVEKANRQAGMLALNAEYFVMDCEKMQFPDSSFDLVLDFGTFSSLSLQNFSRELPRVMTDHGTLICIETYGHNPFMNLKRRISAISGRRTKWAARHIMKRRDWKELSGRFSETRICYFHFMVLFLPPLLKIIPRPLGEMFLAFFEKMDKVILKSRLFRFLAFKTVVLMSKPVRTNN